MLATILKHQNLKSSLITSVHFMLVCHSSQTKTAVRLAEDFAQELRRCGADVEVQSLDDLEGVQTLQKYNMVSFFISTYGDGEQCDAGQVFYEDLQRVPDNSLRGQFTLFGLGSSLYDVYQGASKDLYRELARSGLQLLGKFGLGDDGKGALDDDYGAWKFEIVPELAATMGLKYEVGGDFEPRYEVREIDGNVADAYVSGPPYHVDRPYLATIDGVKQLTGGDMVKRVVHASLDLGPLKYTTGDHVGIYPRNNKEDVTAFLKLFGLYDKRNQSIRVRPPVCPGPTSYAQICTHFLEINHSLSRYWVHKLAGLVDEKRQEELLDAAKSIGNSKGMVTLYSLLSTVSSDWSNVPFSFLLEMLGPLKPRYYSISSSSKLQPHKADITVSIVDQGVFSRNLLEITEGDNVPIFLETSKFRLPRDSSKPIILVCAGVGVAPYRAFVAERSEKTYLFYGVRSKESVLYPDSWKDIEMYLAESRPKQGSKTYVQDLLLQKKDLVLELLKQDASVFVCGDAKSMAKGVWTSFLHILEAEKGGIKAADKYLRFRKVLGKYREDVW